MQCSAIKVVCCTDCIAIRNFQPLWLVGLLYPQYTKIRNYNKYMFTWKENIHDNRKYIKEDTIIKTIPKNIKW